MNRLKTFFVLLMLCFTATMVLTACDSDKNVTYYPDKSEMQYNLTTAGYKIYSTNILVGDGTGKFLSATKNGDYIKIYWLDDADDCEYYFKLLEEDNPDCEALVQIKNDEKWGNIVYCGTKAAVNDAGIKVVNVKVDVDVKI